jgi:creatinine amidohydrolase
VAATVQVPGVRAAAGHHLLLARAQRLRRQVSASARTLLAYVSGVAQSLARSGVRRLVLVNGHGGNYALSNVVQEANVGERRMSLFPSRTDWDRARREGGLETAGHDDMHAGELEVSLLLHVAPELVGAGYEDADWPASDRPHLLTLGMDGYTKSGVIGRPSLGTAEKGQAALASLVESFSGHLTLLDPDSAI